MSKELNPFAALAAQFDFAPVPTVGMDGTPVIIDRELGKLFHNRIMTEYAAVLGGCAVLAGEPVSDKTVARLQQRLERLYVSDTSEIQEDDLVGVTGQGLLTVEEYDGDFDVKVLTQQSTLFGYLEGIAFGDYHYVEGIELIPPETEVELPVQDREGLILVLGTAMLCSAEEPYGFLEDKYKYALLPLAEPGFTIHKAIAC